MFESFLQDVRIGLRVLFKEKSFCFLAVLVLALGIGAATTQFTVVNATVLRGFSFPHPEQLMMKRAIRASSESVSVTSRRLRTTRICARPSNRSRRWPDI